VALQRPQETIGVWDPFVRIAHWALAATVIAAWLTRHSAGRLHEWLGYAALALVAARVLWGAIGPHHARFSTFVRPPAATLLYARQVLSHDEPRHIGHNPLGAWMIVALVVSVALVCTTGWLFTTDEYWGVVWVARLHEWFSDLVVSLVGLHVAGVVFSSVRHRENLIGAMVHGRKRAPAEGDRS
jgi:cytochrome b